MKELTFVFVGVLAAGSSVLAISTRYELETRIIAAGFAFIAWALWGFGAQSVVTCKGTGKGLKCHQAMYPGLTFLAVIGVAAMFLLTAYHVLEAFGVDVDRALGVRR